MSNLFKSFLICLLVVSCSHNKEVEVDCDCNCNKDAKANALYEELIKDKLTCMNMPRPECSYNYPVLPGMDAWAKFTTTQAMIDACQVPEAVLKCQSTQALMEALWEYPFFFEITFRHNHYQQDFETNYLTNKAYNVFINRKDAAQSIFTRLLLVDPLGMAKIGGYGLELFMSQPLFLQQLSKDDKRKLVTLCFKNDSLRFIDDGSISYARREITWMLIGRTLVTANYKPFVDLVNSNSQLKQFLNTSIINVYSEEEYKQFFQLIISNGQAFIK